MTRKSNHPGRASRSVIAALTLCVLTPPGIAVAQESEATNESQAADNNSGATWENDFGAKLRANLFHKSWREDHVVDLDFETVVLTLDTRYDRFSGSVDYRFYNGYNMLRYGYVAYTFPGGSELRGGIHRKPFGLLPFASHSYFFDLGFYLGMEDDADLGVKWVLPSGPAEFQIAYYRTDEGSYFGNSIDSSRYSYDLVQTSVSELGLASVPGELANVERDQFNGRAALKKDHGNIGATEFGVSAEFGGIYNSVTDRTGTHWATAVHVDGNYGPFNLQFEGIRFQFRPENPVGADRRFVIMGAYDGPYKIASEGWIALANLAYSVPLQSRWMDSLTLYGNYGYLRKSEDSFADTQQVVLGSMIGAGRVLLFVDTALGKNHPWISANYGSGLAEGDANAEWEWRFNVNMSFRIF